MTTNGQRRFTRALAAVVLVGAIAAAVLQGPGAVSDFTSAFTHLRAARLPWVGAAVGAEFVSFVFYSLVQDALLRAGQTTLPLGVLLRLAIASSGLRALLPAGAVPSSGWLYGEYRELGVPGPVALYGVLASGFVSTVCILGLLLVGAAVANVAPVALLASSSAVLVVGSAGFVAAVHRLERFPHLAEGRTGRLARLARRLIAVATQVSHVRVGWGRGTRSFLAATGNWCADLVCLVGAFALLDVSLPWRGLLYAYCASQLAGSIVPLPGGLGAVEGGLVGAFAATGLPAGEGLAVAVVYRVITYWGVALIGGIELVALARRPLRTPRAPQSSAADARADETMGRSRRHDAGRGRPTSGKMKQ